ncbi:MAG TPA: hypothetical protein VGA69_09100 [Nitriliruptorales bacterium]
MTSTVRINVWSGPRNVSTALMYAFGQRPDTTVFDEPLYGHYLRVSGVQHPLRDAILTAMDTDGERVVAATILGPHPTPVVMFKQMAHHLVELDRSFLDRCHNVLLIRDPREVLLSYAEHVELPTLADLGYEAQVELLDHAIGRGLAPLVIDARRVLEDPPGQLAGLCEVVGIPFHEAMLSWPPGPKPADGVWAEEWYEGVHASTGFAPYRPRDGTLPTDLQALHVRARPLYERLRTYAV